MLGKAQMVSSFWRSTRLFRLTLIFFLLFADMKVLADINLSGRIVLGSIDRANRVKPEKEGTRN
jgi:hypothetical protein